MIRNRAIWLGAIALCLGGCASSDVPRGDRALEVLQRLKTAHLGDALFDEDAAETLKRDLGARSLVVIGSGAYSQAVLTDIAGLERAGPRGPAQVTVERWETPEGPAVKVVFDPRGGGVTGSQVSAMFDDYVFERHYGNHLPFPVSFHCSGGTTEREAKIGSRGFEIPDFYHFISRRLPYPVANVPGRKGEVMVLASAPWAISPLPSRPAYPARALRAEREGQARLTCRVTPTGKLEACTVVSERPAGQGFAAAALAWSETAVLTADGAAAEGGRGTVAIDVIFRLGWTEQPCPALSAGAAVVRGGAKA